MEEYTDEKPQEQKPDIKEICIETLRQNDRGDHTSPAILYPHQWLWDSAFIAIGLRHLDPGRAAKEIANLVQGQWANGMMPHMIFNNGKEYRLERESWQSWLSPYAPDNRSTSGITQPPVLAEAVTRVGQKMNATDRKEFYRYMFEPLVEYHEWLYAERDPHHEGLTLQIHPHEVGMDNTPPWMQQLYEHSRPWWIAAIEKLHLDFLVNIIRRDTRRVSPGQRISNVEAMMLWDVVRRLRRKKYDIDKILHRSLFCTEDVMFNSILIRNNTQLKEIAKALRRNLPEELLENMKKTEKALEQLYDEETKQYYSRDFITHKLLKQPTIATFMPLYSGAVTKERAEQLVNLLKDHKQYWLHHPVPSVPLSSEFFSAERYWQGPTWVNTNWLIIEGLKRYGYNELAEELRQKTISTVENAGPYEYFSPIDGHGLGAEDFSWTAALTLDLLS